MLIVGGDRLLRLGNVCKITEYLTMVLVCITLLVQSL